VWTIGGLLSAVTLILLAGTAGSATGLTSIGPDTLGKVLAAALLARMVSFPKALGAGLVMGYGARKAGGCTSGHGMSGMALMSPATVASAASWLQSSLETSMSFMSGSLASAVAGLSAGASSASWAASSASSPPCPYSLTLLLSTLYTYIWYKYMTKMTSSRKQARRCNVGMEMQKLNKSSTMVFKTMLVRMRWGIHL